MDNGVHIMLPKNGLDSREITQINFLEGNRFVDDGFNPTNCFSRRVAKVIQNDNVITGLD
jgi:hypothetical protein